MVITNLDFLQKFFPKKSPPTGKKPCTAKAIAQSLLIAYNYRAMPKSFKNILIIKPSSLGDIVLALPTLTALRKSFPDAKISWLIRPEFAPLLENHPHLTNIIIFDRRFLGKAWYDPRAFGSLIALIWRLRRTRFDLVLDLQGLFRTASLAWLTGCKNRFGMTNARELAHIFYTHRIPQDMDSVHLVVYYLKIIQAAGASETQVRFVFPTNPAAVDSVNRILSSHGIGTDNYAVFVPGSVHRDKCWPIERFAALAEKISSQFGLSIIATGTASEKSVVETLKDLANVPIANFAGQTSLSELIALLKAAKLVVSNDTGPGHIAAALGVPMVMIFGPSNPVRLFAYSRLQTVVAVDTFERGLDIRSTKPAHAIQAISVGHVYQKVCEQIKHKPLQSKSQQ